MRQINTILFDIDGTLLDTKEFIFRATEHTLQNYGLQIPDRKEIAKHVGIHFDRFYVNLTGLEDVDHLKAAHGEFQRNNLHLSELYPGTRQILDKLKKLQFKIGAVTSRKRDTVLSTLERAAIVEFFDCIITTDDIQNLKPDPEPILKALELLGSKPEHAMVVGDSDVDVIAGKAAGTKTIRALYGFHQENLENPKPDFVIEDIVGLLEILGIT